MLYLVGYSSLQMACDTPGQAKQKHKISIVGRHFLDENPISQVIERDSGWGKLDCRDFLRSFT